MELLEPRASDVVTRYQIAWVDREMSKASSIILPQTAFIHVRRYPIILVLSDSSVVKCVPELPLQTQPVTLSLRQTQTAPRTLSSPVLSLLT